MNDENSLSRRDLVAGLGGTLAAGSVALAQSGSTPASTAQPLENATTKYPRPPYTSPFQPWPGLASKMVPPPDQSLAKQLGPRGIRVNGVAPGPIYTPLQISGGATEEKWRNFGKDYPLGRAGQPAELASIYVQLAAEDASYTTGNIYGAGGGKGQP